MESDILTDDDIRQIWLSAVSWGGRLVRGASYFLIAYVLSRVNSYGIPGPLYLAFAVGLLGAGSSSARIAQAAIAVLLFMAVLPVSVITALKAAVM